MTTPPELVSLETEIKHLLVEALQLEDVNPAGIDAEAPLFGSGLGLDSIDALELATALEGRYGVQFSRATANAQAVFRSVRTLAEHVSAHRTKP